VRRTLRALFAEIEKDHPALKQTILSAMGNLQPDRLLDPRFLDSGQAPAAELLPVLPGS
jgi:tRNA 2-thiocytidine biosynthesis protein TtcA